MLERGGGGCGLIYLEGGLLANRSRLCSRFSASAVRNRVPIEELCCLGGVNLSCGQGCGVCVVSWVTGSCVTEWT